MNKKNIAIIGLGMLGSSLAEGLKKSKYYNNVIGVARREETRQKAIKLNIVDVVFEDISDAVKDADIVIFCTPIPTTEKLVKANCAMFKSGAIISDIASTKKQLVENCTQALQSRPNVTFIGAHPMAGSEKSGLEFRKLDMYKNARVFVTPEPGTLESQVDEISKVWELVGATTVEIDKEKHDEVVAYASQALHVVASGAAQAVLGNEDGRLCAAASAGGFRDLTRIASSNPTMWREILENNPDGNILALTQIIEQLNRALQLMHDRNWDEIEEFFATGKQLKDDYLKTRDLI